MDHSACSAETTGCTHRHFKRHSRISTHSAEYSVFDDSVFSPCSSNSSSYSFSPSYSSNAVNNFSSSSILYSSLGTYPSIISIICYQLLTFLFSSSTFISFSFSQSLLNTINLKFIFSEYHLNNLIRAVYPLVLIFPACYFTNSTAQLWLSSCGLY